MDNDLLAKFRKDKSPAAPVEAVPPSAIPGAPRKEIYLAVSTKDKHRGARIDLRVRDGYSHAVAYSHLYEIVYDRREFKSVFLIFNSLSCQIEGSGLRSLVDAVRLGSADYIEEFDPEVHERPQDPMAPFIEKMTLVSAAEVRARKAARGQ